MMKEERKMAYKAIPIVIIIAYMLVCLLIGYLAPLPQKGKAASGEAGE